MFLQDFAEKILHVHVKESVRQLNGRNGRLDRICRGQIRGVAGTSSQLGTDM